MKGEIGVQNVWINTIINNIRIIDVMNEEEAYLLIGERVSSTRDGIVAKAKIVAASLDLWIALSIANHVRVKAPITMKMRKKKTRGFSIQYLLAVR